MCAPRSRSNLESGIVVRVDRTFASRSVTICILVACVMSVLVQRATGAREATPSLTINLSGCPTGQTLKVGSLLRFSGRITPKLPAGDHAILSFDSNRLQWPLHPNARGAYTEVLKMPQYPGSDQSTQGLSGVYFYAIVETPGIPTPSRHQEWSKECVFNVNFGEHV